MDVSREVLLLSYPIVQNRLSNEAQSIEIFCDFANGSELAGGLRLGVNSDISLFFALFLPVFHLGKVPFVL
jgi:hypothetical protein